MERDEEKCSHCPSHGETAEAPARFASVPIPPSRLKFLGDLPSGGPEELAKLAADVRDRGEIYDDTIITPAFEARNVNQRGVHAVKNGHFGLFHSANNDFPWRVPAGTDESSNASRWFVRIPPESGKPVVARKEVPFQKFDDAREYWRWYFPIGTQFVEVARVHDASGKPWTFQVNQLTLTQAGWQPTIYRSELLVSADALSDRFGDVGMNPVAVVLKDDKHPKSPAFSTEGALVELPALPASALADSKFVRAASWGKYGDVEIAGPTTTEFSLVPKNFTGCLIPVSVDSCVRCHQDAGQHVNKFDTFARSGNKVGARHWYGVIRGNDRILSWHPFAEETISTEGKNNAVVLRSGAAEIFDRNRHNAADYPGIK